MTVKEWKEKAGGALANEADSLLDIWSNDACMGYVITAAKEAGLSKDEIERLLAEMRIVFDEVSIDEAISIYYNT